MVYLYVLQCNKDNTQKAIGIFTRLKDAKRAAKKYAVDLGQDLFCRITRCPKNKTSDGILIEKIVGG